MNLSNFLLILSTLGIGLKCHAFPDGAGTCGSGKSIGSDSFGIHGSTGSGSLELGSLKMLLNSGEISEFEIGTETSTVLESGKDYPITLSSNTQFRGFLIRLAPKGSQNIGTTLSTTYSLAKDLSICPENVNAITHNSRSLKTAVPFSLSFEEGGDYLLEVTVVRSRSAAGSNDWFYSSFDLTVEVPTSAPTKMAVSTPAPTVSPTANPTNSPTISPTANPTNSPTISPTAREVGSPSAAPTPKSESSVYSVDYRIRSILIISSIITFVLLG